MNKKRDDFSPAIKREIASWSNWRCMICQKSISKKGQPKVAHIVPASKDGPRAEYYDQYDEGFRKSKDNGLLLCGQHHDMIDDDETKPYKIDELFEINHQYQENYEIENSINDLFYSDYRAEDTELATKKLIDFLELSESDFEKEVQQSYKDTLLDKIDLDDKLEKNKFSEFKRRTIKNFVKYYGLNYYAALTFVESEAGNLYFLTAVKLLYKKFKNCKTEDEKYNKMLKVLKKCCVELNSENESFNEMNLLNYYFYVCEVFLR
ncbi:MAG: HNH endonuclease signature motif containing protein [Bacilli bacterium]